MAGTDRGDRARGDRTERRRFVTRSHVEDAAATGQPIRVQGRDVVTDEAAQRAADLGVRIERDSPPGTSRRSGSGSGAGSSGKPSASAAASTASAPSARAASDADLRRVVRAAVVAELGTEPPGLDAVIDRVLKSRSR